MTLLEHYRQAEEATAKAERALSLGDPHEALAYAGIAAAHALLASIPTPAGGRG